MENKLYFLLILVGCVLLFLGIIVSIILLLMDKKEHWRDYDSYILGISWAPSICYNQNDKTKEKDCFSKLDELNINTSFIINGLRPEYSNGDDIEKCNKDEDIEIKFNDKLNKTLSTIWPGLTISDNDKWNYEYNQYGYCYIQRLRKNVENNYTMYFNKTRDIFLEPQYYDLIEHVFPDTPQGLHTILKQKFKIFINESTIALAPSTYSLRCEKNKDNDTFILSELWLNYDIDFNLTSKVKLEDNCPDRFDIYFRNKNKIPVWEKFDHYVMTIFWPATFCLSQGKECYKKLKEGELNINTIHGLWPSYKDKNVPQWCNLDTNIEINNSTNDMETYWINMDMENNKQFWNHEYNKHGFCYNKRINKPTEDYLLYFNKTIEVYNNITNIANQTINLKDLMKQHLYPGIFAGMNKLSKSYLTTKLQELFGNGTFGFTCLEFQGNYYLYEIKVFLDTSFTSLYTEGFDSNCPGEIYAEFLENEGKKKQAPDNFYKEYDMYFFTILWLGTTCHQKGPQCYERIPNATKNKFSLHGLWPNLRNGTVEQGFCNGPNDIEIDIKNETLLNFMNNHYVSGYHTNPYFWGHEYNKHGYCYNQRVNHDVNDYEFFFQKSKDMFVDNNFENLFVDFFAKEKIEIKVGDMEINRTKFELFFNDKGFSNDKYLIVCANITDEFNNTHPHISEMRIRYDLDFNLLKNETDKSEFDCPEIFYAQFFGKQN